MYEVLRTLTLPGFALDNWRSTIRDRVAIHDKYKEMPPWIGVETADIVYADHEHKLTEMLIANNYFGPFTNHPSFLASLSPTYYIEAKTTPGQLNIPFFGSQGQLDRMESMKLQILKPANEIYMIARVFKLGGSGMGLKLYVDPAGLRSNGALKFTADKYSVTLGIPAHA